MKYHFSGKVQHQQIKTNCTINHTWNRWVCLDVYIYLCELMLSAPVSVSMFVLFPNVEMCRVTGVECVPPVVPSAGSFAQVFFIFYDESSMTRFNATVKLRALKKMSGYSTGLIFNDHCARSENYIHFQSAAYHVYGSMSKLVTTNSNASRFVRPVDFPSCRAL